MFIFMSPWGVQCNAIFLPHNGSFQCWGCSTDEDQRLFFIIIILLVTRVLLDHKLSPRCVDTYSMTKSGLDLARSLKASNDFLANSCLFLLFLTKVDNCDFEGRRNEGMMSGYSVLFLALGSCERPSCSVYSLWQSVVYKIKTTLESMENVGETYISGLWLQWLKKDF